MRPVRPAPPLGSLPSTAADVAPPAADIHFGLLLRRARERRGLSLQDVARVTRISDKWLPALEDARLDSLPAPVFVTGYVRSYARVVGLDEGDLIERYHTLIQHVDIPCPPVRLQTCESSEPGAQPAQPVRRLYILAAVLLAVLGCALWSWLRLHAAR